MRTVAVLAVLCLVPTQALAQRGTRKFGDAGVFSPGGSMSLDVTSYDSGGSTPPGASSPSTKTLSLQPAVWYFVTDGLALGGVALVQVSKTGSADATTTFGVGPAVGYNVNLATGVSLFPSFTVRVAVHSAGNGSSVTQKAGVATVDVPLLLHWGNFYLGFGPYLHRVFWSKLESGAFSSDQPKSTTLGVGTTIGGWL